MRKPMPNTGVCSILEWNFQGEITTLAEIQAVARFLNPQIITAFWTGDKPIPIDNIKKYYVAFMEPVISPVVEENDYIDIYVEPRG